MRLACLWLWLSFLVSFWIGPGAARVGYAQSRSLSQQLSEEDRSALAQDVRRFGNPVRGALAFFRPELNCAKCHEPGATGRRLGPDLSERREVQTESLIQSVLQPSAEIKAGFETWEVLLQDGRTVSGLKVRSDEQAIWLDRIEEATEPLRIPWDDIDEHRPNRVSTMPEGLANPLGDRQAFLDLICYLTEIAAGGPARAAQLRPAAVASQLAPLPAYESQVDHRGLIESWDQTMLEQGAELYRLRCATCHGDATSEGTMPTSLRFPSGTFKRGKDPHSIYLTLTHGFGMMNAQRWMVPEQKYAVIHYVRETFLREQNPSQYFEVTEEYLAKLPTGTTRGPKPENLEPWTRMDYGPSLLNTIEIGNDGSNIAQKGIAIRLDPGPGGVAAGSHWILYDHDTLRVAGAWTGKFLDYNGIHFNGVHGQHPRTEGTVLWKNQTGPGWGNPENGSFADQRLQGRDGKRYGPLPRSWAKYLGLYRFGQQTILNYRVGTTEILETPSLEFVQDLPWVVRHLTLGPRDRDLILQVAQPDSTTKAHQGGQLWLPEQPENPESARGLDGQRFFQVNGADSLETLSEDFSWSARIRTNQDGTLVSKTLDQPRWSPNAQSWFIRDGRLTFDIGWVGAVQSSRDVADGQWHAVRMNWSAATGKVSFFVDGQEAGGGVLRPTQRLQQSVLRIGASNHDFPQDSFFVGEMEDVQVSQGLWQPDNQAGEPPQELRIWGAWKRLLVTDPKDTDSDSRPLRAVSTTRTQATPTTGWWATAITDSGPVANEQWLVEPGHLRLRIPAGPQPLKLKVAVVSLPNAEALANLPPPQAHRPESFFDLASLTQGGPANWPDLMTTQVKTLSTNPPLAVDVLPHPEENPWNCRLRMTGFDFVPGADAAIVATWDGSIWRVDGIRQTQPGSPLTWRRVAAGLFQPLGLKIREGVVFVTCRDQLVSLHDLNGDGEYDWYQCFNNDHQVTEHFHEFAMGLQADAEGNFYYAKSARHALPALVPHHGTLLKVSRDGERTEIVANGFRAANGVCLNPDGSFVVTDQEGHWNPKNRINWVSPGGFYGNMLGYHEGRDPSDAAMQPPLCWITNSMDRSPAELLWVPRSTWGPLAGQLLNLSYGYGKIYVVPHEQVNGLRQGGVCELPLPQFPTGIMRGRFDDVDGQLYSCGMFAWSGTQEQPGGLYRIRMTGDALPVATGLRAFDDSLELDLGCTLDPRIANDPENYSVRVWGLRRTANYGSEHLDERELPVTSAQLLDNGRTVRLQIKGIAPTWCMEIAYALRTLSGEPCQGKIHNTIHALTPRK